MEFTPRPAIEALIEEWRTYLQRRGENAGLSELEDRLRKQMADLCAASLSDDEAFLIAIRRTAAVHPPTRDFARGQSSQLVISGHIADRTRPTVPAYRDVLITVCFAIGAALAFKLPAALGIDPFGSGGSESEASFYLRNASLLVLPFLVGLFAWKRSLPVRALALLAVPFVVAAVLINAFPFETAGDTEVLAGAHLPIVIWLIAGVAYMRGIWRVGPPWMEFVRFTGEWVIYFALIAIGGGVLTALSLGVFQTIGVDLEPVVAAWILPCGAAGAVIVVAWLVEARQAVMENVAPVLTGVFTPLFALMLVAVLVGMALTGNIIDADRDVLLLFDALLVFVVGLVLYATSARAADARPTLMDAAQLVLVASALLVDVLALVAMLGRITEFGLTPNRTAALGLNVVLLGNLFWSAWLLSAFLRRRRPPADLERWQTAYLPVYAAWALTVVAVFPPLFGFD